jgi:hypothetical protein
MTQEREPYKSNGTCGSVNQEVVYWGDSERYYRKGSKGCRKCEELKNVRRRCLRCDKMFTPGCKAPFTCSRCFSVRGSDG